MRASIQDDIVVTQSMLAPESLTLIVRIEHCAVDAIGDDLDSRCAARFHGSDETRRVDDHLVRVAVQKALQSFCEPDQERLAQHAYRNCKLGP